jgi:hypothetical protein
LRVFEKLISSTHLKHCHQITSAEYKKQFGPDSLASPDYRAERSRLRSGANNSMYGKTHSDAVKASISEKNTGKIPHNKGQKITDLEQLETLRKSLKLRDERYKETGYHPRRGKPHSPATKKVLSDKGKEYAAENPDQLKARAKKMQQTKVDNGYYQGQKANTKIKYTSLWDEYGYDVEFIDEFSKVTHRVCQSSIIRSTKSVMHDKVCLACYPSQKTSKEEKELATWLKSVTDEEIITNDTHILDNGFELDIVLPARKIAIEFNGLYWHSESCGKGQWYHKTKTHKCNNLGYRLIQILEDEWIHKQQIVKNRLLHILGMSKKIVSGARKCQISKISISDARKFHIEHHVQGYGTGTQCYGLSVNQELIAVMDFSNLSKVKGSTPINNSWELTRFSTAGSIPGAAQRLFNKFIVDNNPESIISYSDIRWNTGQVYKKLGMTLLAHTVPGYWYVKGTYRFHRWKFRKDELVRQGHDANLTEKEIMKSQGYLRIWDCGHDKWIWSKK